MAIYSESDIRGQRGTFNFDTTLKVRDVEPRIALIQPYRAPFISLLSAIGSFPTAAVKFEMYEDDLALPLVSVDGAVSSTTQQNIQLASGQASRLVIDAQLYNPLTAEYMRVFRIDTANDIVYVTRGEAGSSAVDIANSTNLIIASEGREEGIPIAPVAISTKAATLYNYVEEFETPVEASWLQMGTRDYTTPDFDYQVKKAVPTHKEKMERAFWIGARNLVNAGSTAGKPVYYTGGADWWIRNNSPSANIKTLTNTPLTDIVLEDWLEPIFRYGNPDRKCLFTSPAGKLVLTRLAKGPVRTVRTEGTLGMNITKMTLLGFEIPIISNLMFPLIGLTNSIYCMDMDYVRMRHLAAQGMEFTTKWLRNIQPPDLKGRKDALHTIAGFSWKVEQAHGVLSGFLS